MNPDFPLRAGRGEGPRHAKNRWGNGGAFGSGSIGQGPTGGEVGRPDRRAVPGGPTSSGLRTATALGADPPGGRDVEDHARPEEHAVALGDLVPLPSWTNSPPSSLEVVAISRADSTRRPASDRPDATGTPGRATIR